jgi:hypothetical protein
MEFEFGKCNNQIMDLSMVVDDDPPIQILPNDDQTTQVNITVDMPTQLVLQFKGKDPNTGTLVDNNGLIIEDMFVKILSVAFDGFELNEKFIHQKIKLVTDTGQEILTSYIGFNGTVTLDLAESDMFSQYLLMNS